MPQKPSFEEKTRFIFVFRVAESSMNRDLHFLFYVLRITFHALRMSYRINRRELRGAACRVVSEKYANTSTSTYSRQNGFNSDNGGPLNRILHKFADRPRKAVAQHCSQSDTDKAPNKTQDNRFDKKLYAYIKALRANSFTQPNFRDALCGQTPA